MRTTRTFLLFLHACLFMAAFGQDTNPLATVKIGGRLYYLHLVESGETLYKLSKEYELNVNDIIHSNPWGNDTVIRVGQVLKVPVESFMPATKPTGAVPATPQEKPAAVNYVPPVATPADPPVYPKNVGYLVVEKGHTLYGISKAYNVNVQQLKEWNALDSLVIELGDTIFVKAPSGKPGQSVHSAHNYEPAVVAPLDQDRPLVDKPASAPAADAGNDSPLKNQFTSTQDGTRELRTQRGSTGTIITSQPAMKSVNYCLHRSAPIGSVVRLQSLVTHKTTFAKVLGKLPDTEENEPFMIRVSEAAAKELGITTEKTFVEISYYE